MPAPEQPPRSAECPPPSTRNRRDPGEAAAVETTVSRAKSSAQETSGRARETLSAPSGNAHRAHQHGLQKYHQCLWQKKKLHGLLLHKQRHLPPKESFQKNQKYTASQSVALCCAKPGGRKKKAKQGQEEELCLPETWDLHNNQRSKSCLCFLSIRLENATPEKHLVQDQ